MEMTYQQFPILALQFAQLLRVTGFQWLVHLTLCKTDVKRLTHTS